LPVPAAGDTSRELLTGAVVRIRMSVRPASVLLLDRTRPDLPFI
jgi:hypothetical protein